ncbi:MAG: hypothetical protein D6785_02080, partial [Planctomycetota bacterium]
SSHNPANIGCSACHLGNPYKNKKVEAHENMVALPGNLAFSMATCGKPICHPQLSAHLQNSLMATGRGMVAKFRYVFGEAPNLSPHSHLSLLTHSIPDKYLRNLCASCHLNQQKIHFGPITEKSRGGGCLACHIYYSDKALQELKGYFQKKRLPRTHPMLTARVQDKACFGCHSRSSRISLSYEGWHELPQDARPSHPSGPLFRILKDGRVLQKIQPDIHFELGLSCIDCHTFREIMGDGKIYTHQLEQPKIQCIDCHSPQKSPWIEGKNLSMLDKKVALLRGTFQSQRRFLKTKRGGYPILGAFYNELGQKVLQLRFSKRNLILKPYQAICRGMISRHKRLSCESCHSGWAPQCIQCHASYNSDKKGWDHLLRKKVLGSWKEKGSLYLAELPALGVVKRKNEEIILPFVPGMILSAEWKTREEKKKIFRRLYSPIFPHTSLKKGRSCKSCHQNPLALGFGRGKLILIKERKKWYWKFIPKFPPHPQDGMPIDSWIHPLTKEKKVYSTTFNSRPFTVEEQKRILRVGACLECHPANSQNLKKIYTSFQKALKHKHKFK